MRVLGIDLGSKTMGLAVTDSNQIIASALENFYYQNQDLNLCLNKMIQLVNYYKNDLSEIVLGYPLKNNHSKNPNTYLVEQFYEMLKNQFPYLKIILQDERYSTLKATYDLKFQAKLKSSKIKKIKDKMAAVVILEDYLENKLWINPKTQL